MTRKEFRSAAEQLLESPEAADSGGLYASCLIRAMIRDGRPWVRVEVHMAAACRRWAQGQRHRCSGVTAAGGGLHPAPISADASETDQRTRHA